MDPQQLLKLITSERINILDSSILLSKYAPLDLSIHNKELLKYDITDVRACQAYIDKVLAKSEAKVAYGGYLEKRNLYSGAKQFNDEAIRNIHLGMDFWCDTETTVLTPLDGIVHSFNNNNAPNDYGPTIILSHEIDGAEFHTLYGHLSMESLDGLKKGQPFKRGEVIGTLGSEAVNGGYAPHLHFQAIIDLQGNEGDYPGVCSEETMEFYAQNCPNPNLLLNI